MDLTFQFLFHINQTYVFSLILSINFMESQIITISQTSQGYDIYSNGGELILEFTSMNCDSLSLNTLSYIFDTSKEFNVDPKKFKQQYKDKPKNFIATIR